jgi:hypothetical protein
MKVLDLRCAQDHRFEGWFASDDDYASQLGRGLVACPLCDDHEITRLPSAPRLNVSNLRDQSAAAPPAAAEYALARAQGQALRQLRRLIAATEDVGERFPDEARRIHYGEAEDRAIRGRASRAEADTLREEGIEVMALPMPELLKGPTQ